MYHHSEDGINPVCSTVGQYERISSDDVEQLGLCHLCWKRHTYDDVSIDYGEEITTELLSHIKTDWKTVRGLSEVMEPSKSSIRRRLNELVQAGRVNRRGGMHDTDGSKGYEYSQQSVEQTSYEENTNLFESMLDD